MNPRPIGIFYLALIAGAQLLASPASARDLDPETRERCLEVLRVGLGADDFWPSIHAAEALTLAGDGDAVREHLEPKLETEVDDQRRCGLARELVRAGEREKSEVMLDILCGADTHGHVHAAESLYKVGWVGSVAPLRAAFRESDGQPLRLMAAAALARHADEPEAGEALAFLRETLRESPDSDIIRLTAWILARVGDSSDVARVRARLYDVEKGLDRAYLEHALAALGDPAGKRALLRNLESDDPAVRTYAATFAGEAGLVEAVPGLIRRLDDEHLDARIRAAQSLLALSRKTEPPPP